MLYHAARIRATAWTGEASADSLNSSPVLSTTSNEMNTAHANYLEGRISSASPVELICLLCEAARNAAWDAGRCLAAGDHSGRSRAISKAQDAIVELLRSLDTGRGGPLAQRLGELYGYIYHLLGEAHIQQSPVLLKEAEKLLGTVHEAWTGVSKALLRPAPPAVTHQSALHL
jgi:flagellar protein FliS